MEKGQPPESWAACTMLSRPLICIRVTSPVCADNRAGASADTSDYQTRRRQRRQGPNEESCGLTAGWTVSTDGATASVFLFLPKLSGKTWHLKPNGEKVKDQDSTMNFHSCTEGTWQLGHVVSGSLRVGQWQKTKVCSKARSVFTVEVVMRNMSHTLTENTFTQLFWKHIYC